MMTYLIQAEGTYWVKIGRGKDPRARRADMQVSCPYRLCRIIEMPGDWERRLHDLMDPYRGIGEWFDLSTKRARCRLTTDLFQIHRTLIAQGKGVTQYWEHTLRDIEDWDAREFDEGYQPRGWQYARVNAAPEDDE